MKKFLFINQYVTQLFIDILNAFADRGHQVTLLTGKVIASGKPLLENVEVVYMTPYRRNQSVARITTWLRFTREAMRYVRNQGADVELVLSTNPPLLIPLMTNVAGTGQLKYHLIIYDLYPDALANHWSGRNGWFRNWWTQRNRIVMGGASSVITIGEKIKAAVGAYLYGSKGDQVQVVPCWADLEHMQIEIGHENTFAAQQGITGKFVVLYSGNLGATHDFDTLLHAANRLVKYEDIHFVLIGDGALKKSISRKVKKFGLFNVTMLPFQEPAILPLSFGTADIGIVSQGAGAELFSVPSKTYYYMAAGAALLGIAGDGSELEQITDRFANGKVFRHGSVDEVRDFILNLHDHPDIRECYRTNSRLAASHFTPENALSIYRIITESGA